MGFVPFLLNHDTEVVFAFFNLRGNTLSNFVGMLAYTAFEKIEVGPNLFI